MKKRQFNMKINENPNEHPKKVIKKAKIFLRNIGNSIFIDLIGF